MKLHSGAIEFGISQGVVVPDADPPKRQSKVGNILRICKKPFLIAWSGQKHPCRNTLDNKNMKTRHYLIIYLLASIVVANITTSTMAQEAFQDKNLQKTNNVANLQSNEEGPGMSKTGLTSNNAETVIGLKYRGNFVYEVVQKPDGTTTERLSSVAWSDGRVSL